MTGFSNIVVNGAGEGDLDVAVLRRLVEQAGATLGKTYVKGGKTLLKKRLNAYNQAAQWVPWVVLIDLNHDADCAPPMKLEYLPNPAINMCFRIAVRMIEAWLLADHKSLASFLGISASQIPTNPEVLDDPKNIMVELAKHSRRREIREGMAPKPKSGRKVGSAYTLLLIEFAQTQWKPEVAADRSDSLRRCRQRIRELIKSQASAIRKGK